MVKRMMQMAIGLMSGTSMDGVDAALIFTDGEEVEVPNITAFIPYDLNFRNTLRSLLRVDPQNVKAYHHIVSELTIRNVEAVEMLLSNAGVNQSQISVIGFHGQTVFHNPNSNITIQLGDGQLLANRTNIPVVAEMRKSDVELGGQGAPLTPLYHLALSKNLPRPIAVLNIGGVSNLTWIGENDSCSKTNLLAFDTGPGSALIDDWIIHNNLGSFDLCGMLASKGKVNEKALSLMLSHPYLKLSPPKSLDRNEFDPSPIHGLSPEDGAATLTALTVRSIAMSLVHFPSPVSRWLICGGGRKNETIMGMLRHSLGVSVEPVESVGWSGDYLEAEAFAFLAVRSTQGKVLSLPTTTGVGVPMSGGKLFSPEKKSLLDRC